MQGWFSVREEEKHQRLNLLLTDSQTMVGCRWWWCTFMDNIYTTFTISVVTSERSSKWPQFFSILKILRIWWCCGFKGYCISGKPSLMMIFSFETCRPWPNSDKVATQYMFHLAELAMSCLCLSQKLSYLLLVRIGNRMARLAQLAISLCGWFPLALARHQPSRRGKTWWSIGAK